MPPQKHLNHLRKVDPVLKDLINRYNLTPRAPRDDYFESLARSIVGQQLSVKAAASIWLKVKTLFKLKRITPELVLRAPEQQLRQAGLSYSKIAYFKNLAAFFIANRRTVKQLDKLGDEQLIEFLTKIKGIGRWTAEMFMIFTLRRADIFSPGDLGLRNAIVKLYKLRKMPDAKRLEKISRVWSPYRSHASLYLWASLSSQNLKKPNKKLR